MSIRYYHRGKRVHRDQVPPAIRQRLDERVAGGVEPYCYCSYKCGCRKQVAGDTPKYDEATGMRFCAPRDKEAFYSKGCDKVAYKDREAVALCPPRPRPRARAAGSSTARRRYPVKYLLPAAVTMGGIAGASVAAAEMAKKKRRVMPAGLTVVYWEGFPYLFDPFRGYYLPWLNDYVPQLDWNLIMRQARILDTSPAELFHSYDRWRRAMSR